MSGTEDKDSNKGVHRMSENPACPGMEGQYAATTSMFLRFRFQLRPLDGMIMRQVDGIYQGYLKIKSIRQDP